MREIKFRGKIKEKLMKESWLEGSLVHITRTYKGEEDEQECDIYQIINEDGVGFFIDKDTIGQYTGLKDKNGKEIYEGDIVRDMEVYLTHQSYVKQKIESVQEAEKYRYFGNVAVVEFCTQEIASCGCCYQEFVGTGFKAKRVDLTCCEVIGNIYDNPELLEKGEINE